MEEELRTGADYATAFKNAMRSEGVVDLPNDRDEDDFASEANYFEAEEKDEPWRESSPPELTSDDDPREMFERERHPLQQIASNLHVRIFKLFDANESRSSHIGTLMDGAGEIGGGLAQALTERDTPLDGLVRG